MVAGVGLIGRTGARNIRIGYSDEADGIPVVWYATAAWKRPGGEYHEAAGGMSPTAAVLRLCELIIDGGECAHCHRPTIFVPDSDTSLVDLIGCVYAWDPELRLFRRGCEGDS